MLKRILLACAVLVGLAVGIEALMHVLGLGARDSVKVVEVEDEGGYLNLFLRGRGDHTHRVALRVERPASVKRTVMVGGSTVWGHYVHGASTIPTILQCMFNEGIAGNHEVINLGISGANAARVREVLEYALERLSPDLVVVYSGHNELRSNHLAAHLERHEHPLRVASRRAVQRTRTGRYLISLRPPPAAEGGGVLDFLAGYRFQILERSRVAPVRDAVHQDYEDQIEGMILSARQRGVPIVVVEPVSDGLNYGPLVSAFSRDLEAQQREQVVTWLREAAQALQASRIEECEALLDRVQALDPHLADLVHLRAQIAWRRGEVELARRLDRHKRDLDEDQQAFSERLRQRLHAVVQRQGVPLVDVGAELERDQPPGEPPLFLDHVHPSIHGQYAIARGIARTVFDLGALGPLRPGREPLPSEFEAVTSCLGISQRTLEDTARLTLYGDLNWAFFALDPSPYLRRARRVFEQTPEEQVLGGKLILALLVLELFEGRDAEAARIGRLALERKPRAARAILDSLTAHPRLRANIARALPDYRPESAQGPSQGTDED